MTSVAQSEQLAKMSKPLCQKEKEQSHLSTSPDRKVRESQSERELHLDETEDGRNGSMGRQGWTAQ